MTEPAEVANLAAEEYAAPGRRIVLTTASSIWPRRVRWLWSDSLTLGTLVVLAFGEG